MSEILVPVVTDVALPLVQLIILALASLAIRELQRWLAAKGASETAQAVTGRLYSVVDDVVRQANQTLVGDLKAKGQWDRETGIRIKAQVKGEALRLLGDRALVAKALGLSEMGLEDRVGTLIEAEIDRSKRLETTVINNASGGFTAEQVQALVERFSSESGERLLKALLKPIETVAAKAPVDASASVE
jgi:hypothetical protein